jgi:hypothetical protein
MTELADLEVKLTELVEVGSAVARELRRTIGAFGPCPCSGCQALAAWEALLRSLGDG